VRAPPRPALRTGLLALAGAWAAAGCGEEAAPTRTAQTEQPGPQTAARADPGGRSVVATVNGEPIYGDCVATQASAAGLDRDAALAQCIDFELMAQEAARRGLLADLEVMETRRVEMVRALVEAEFAPTLDDPSDVPAADLHWLWDSQLSRRYNRPELRRATYCRVPLESDAAADGPEAIRARELADEMHAALSGLRGLGAELFPAMCWMASGGREVKTTATPTRPFTREGHYPGGVYAATFAEAAFSVGEVGRVSRPTRTSWGWDLVLVTEIAPALTRTFEEAEPEMREMLVTRPETAEYRRRKFQAWIDRYLGPARIELHLENLPDDQALARSAAPEPGTEEADR
jgi:PPIC-type PPIASE domain